MKINTEHALAAPSPCGGVLSATEFNLSEWVILYPHFVE
jgi:hypothetical protein